MASNILNTLKNLRQNLHNVGNLNNWKKKSLNQGAIATEKMDNFTLVTIGFDAVSGERTATPIVASDVKGVLVATPEDYMEGYETISSFFNAQGERVRVVAMEPGMRFECSNVEFEDGNLVANPIKNGQLVHYNHDTKKFVISNLTPDGMIPDYGQAANKLVVVDASPVSLDGQTLYRFEVTQ